MIPKDAIEILKGIQNNLEETRFLERCAIDMAIKALKEQRPHGEWIDVNGDGSLWKCSRCGETSCCRGKYCCECGASMSANDRQVTGKLEKGGGEK